MKRITAVAYCLIIIELLIQIFGGIYNDQIPGFVWALADVILILVPVVFGLKLGLVCLIPFGVSEIVWTCKLQVAGPILHLVSFALTVVILGLVNRKIMQMPRLRRVIISGILYEAFLLGEEALYHGLRMLFMQKSFGWDDISGTFRSPVNVVMLAVLVICCVYDTRSEIKEHSEEK